MPGLADEAAARHRTQVAVDRHDTPVEGRRGAHHLALERNRGVGRRLPRNYGREIVTVAMHEVSEAAVVLDCTCDAGEHAPLLIERTGSIEGGAFLIEASELCSDGERAFGLRLFGNDVEGAAWIATTIEERRGAFQDLNPLDRDDIRRVWIATVHGEAVSIVLPRREAADRKFRQPETCEVIRSADSGKIERRIDAGCGDVLEDLVWHDNDCLWHLAQGRVSARCADTVSGEVTIHFACRPAIADH